MKRLAIDYTIAVLLSLLPLVTGACSKNSDKAKKLSADESGQTAVTLQLNWVPEPEFGGFYTAVADGHYHRAGLNVHISAGAAGVQTWNMVARGKVPLAISSAGELLHGNIKDADLVAVYAVYQQAPTAFMVHEETGVNSLEEIFTSGKIERVALQAELPFANHLRSKYGLDKVKLQQHGNNLSLFLQDKTMAQQCFIFSEPVSAKQQGVPVRAFSLAESGFNPYQAVVITRRDFLEVNRDVVERFVRATRAGWQAYLDDPEPTNKYMRTQGATMTLEAMNLAAELQASYVASSDTEKHGLGYMSLERWQRHAQQLKDLGDLKRLPDVKAGFTTIANP